MNVSGQTGQEYLKRNSYLYYLKIFLSLNFGHEKTRQNLLKVPADKKKQLSAGNWLLEWARKISGDIYIIYLGNDRGHKDFQVLYIIANISAENKIISYLWECWCIISWAWEPHILLQMLHTKCVSSFPPPTSEKRETLVQRPIVRVLKTEQFPEIERTRGITNLI